MTSLPPENAPQLGTCSKQSTRLHGKDACGGSGCINWKPAAAPEIACPACGSGDKARRMYQLNHLPPTRCINPWHDSAAPENQPRPTCEDCGRPARVNNFDPNIFVCDNCETYWKPGGGAQGGVPQPNEYGSPSGIAPTFENGGLGEGGALPPPDERAEYLKKLIHLHFCDEHEEGFYQRSCDARACLICMWDREVEEALSGRARAPQPAGSEKGTDDGVSCEISRTPNIPAGTTGRDDCRDTDRGDNSEAPIAPSKLSAQEFYQADPKEWWVSDDPESWRFAEAYAREYASSSNAALLEANQVIRRQLQKVVDQAEALEGQLREAQQERGAAVEQFVEERLRRLIAEK